MAMFWTCPYGANHDFGERCDCKPEKKTEKLLKKRPLLKKQLLVSEMDGQLSLGQLRKN